MLAKVLRGFRLIPCKPHRIHNDNILPRALYCKGNLQFCREVDKGGVFRAIKVGVLSGRRLGATDGGGFLAYEGGPWGGDRDWEDAAVH